MTEIERIIEEGVFQEDFFLPEIICDFYVDETRKKIWAIEIDLMLQVDRICEKYDLKYFLVWGSMLGAVRHKGFVPWDDDLDIALPREDYEKLLLHSDEFSYPYFLQTPYTDKGYFYTHAKLRNTNTTALDYPFLFQGFNMGIFIDILPLDYISEKTGREDFKMIESLISDNNIAMRLNHPFLNERDKKRVASYHGDDPIRTFEKIQTIAQSCISSDKVSIIVAVGYGYERHVWDADCYKNMLECKMNGVQTYIPNGYDKILQVTYGDYIKFPPIDKRGTWHSNLYFDPDTPYIKSLARWEEFYDKNHPNTIQMTQD